jgi:hypothetical protein
LQWTLERTIGNLGEEIKQHSNPFTNLSQWGIRRARVNALKALIPDLEPDRMEKKDLPRSSKDLGEGFVLLRAQEGEPHPLRLIPTWRLRYVSSGGQSFEYPQARTVTVPGKRLRSCLRSIGPPAM